MNPQLDEFDFRIKHIIEEHILLTYHELTVALQELNELQRDYKDTKVEREYLENEITPLVKEIKEFIERVTPGFMKISREADLGLIPKSVKGNPRQVKNTIRHFLLPSFRKDDDDE